MPALLQRPTPFTTQQGAEDVNRARSPPPTLAMPARPARLRRSSVPPRDRARGPVRGPLSIMPRRRVAAPLADTTTAPGLNSPRMWCPALPCSGIDQRGGAPRGSGLPLDRRPAWLPGRGLGRWKSGQAARGLKSLSMPSEKGDWNSQRGQSREVPLWFPAPGVPTVDGPVARPSPPPPGPRPPDPSAASTACRLSPPTTKPGR